MFDKLIESNSEQAEFKPRRKFFMVSSVVVGIMFLSAVVFSLYAQDIDLGTDNFELAELLAPVAADAPEPEPPRQQPQQRNETQETQLPVRHDLIARMDQAQAVPDKISTTPFTGKTLPLGRFVQDLGRAESDGSGPGPGTPNGTGDGSGSGVDGNSVAEGKLPDPPPAAKAASKPPTIKSEGVINGKATYLPNPAFPAPAKLVGAYGIVNVQVTIDEDGKVISSKAVTGHPLLRGTAESAAWKARFSTTYLSKVPVKVTGVIVFNFKKS